MKFPSFATLFLILSYFFLLPVSKAMWLPLLIMAVWGALGFISELKNKDVLSGTRWLMTAASFIYLPALVSLFGSIDAERTGKFLVGFPLLFLAAYFIFRGVRSIRSEKSLIVGLAVIVLFWGITVLWQILDPSNPFGPSHGARYQGIHTPDNPLFDGSLMLGAILGGLLPFIVLSLYEFGMRRRAWAMGSLIIVLILLSGTRSAWISSIFCFCSFVFLSFYRKSQKKRVLVTRLVGIVVSVALIGVAGLQVGGLKDRINKTLIAFDGGSKEAIDEALSWRITIWEDAIALGNERPFTGYGVNNYRYAVPMLDSPKSARFLSEDKSGRPKGASHTHQIVLETLAGAGWIGVLGLFGFYLFLLRTTLRAFSTASLSCVGALLAIWASFLPLNTHNNFYGGWMIAWFWVWMGIAAGLLFRKVEPAKVAE